MVKLTEEQLKCASDPERFRKLFGYVINNDRSGCHVSFRDATSIVTFPVDDPPIVVREPVPVVNPLFTPGQRITQSDHFVMMNTIVAKQLGVDTPSREDGTIAGSFQWIEDEESRDVYIVNWDQHFTSIMVESMIEPIVVTSE